MAPRIDKRALQTINIKAGQIIAFDVPVEGEPPPKCTWYHEGEEKKAGGRYNVLFSMKSTYET